MNGVTFSVNGATLRMMRLIVLLALALTLPLSAQMARRAPGFSLPDINLRQHDMQDYKGKVVLLELMKTDCPRCQVLSKTLEQAKAKYGDKVQVLSIVVPPDNQNTVKQYIATHKITSPFLFDCGQVVAAYLNLSPSNPSIHFPHLIVVDKNGQIRRDIEDANITLAALATTLDPLLK